MFYSEKLKDLENILAFLSLFSTEWPKIIDKFIIVDYCEFSVARYQCSICQEKSNTSNSIIHKDDCFIGKLEKSFKLIEENSN